MGETNMRLKKRVALSRWAVALTVVLLVVFAGIIAVSIISANKLMLVCWVAGVSVLLCAAMFYAPLSVGVDDRSLTVWRPLWFRSIPLSDIESVRLCQPTMGARRICGSGGFCGYWGWFSERDLGRYFAYYGRSSDCFLVTLRDGRRYMLGCADAPAMVEAVSARL